MEAPYFLFRTAEALLLFAALVLLSLVTTFLAGLFGGWYGRLVLPPLMLFAAWLPVVLDRRWSDVDRSMERSWDGGSEGSDVGKEC